jgi:hypothetical protein
MAEDIDDPTNIVGLGNMVNKKHTDEKLDLDAIEKHYIGRIGSKIIPEHDPIKELKKTVGDLFVDTGITLNGDIENDSSPLQEPEIIDETADDLAGIEELDNGVPEDFNMGAVGESDFPEEPSNQYQEFNERYRKPPDSRPIRPRPQMATSRHVYGQSQGYTQRYDQNQEYEHDRSTNLDEALKTYTGRNDDISFEQELAEDEKSILLEDIDELRYELESDGQNLSRIPEVNEDSSVEAVKRVHKMLRMKYDRKRCNGFGSELILASAQGLEYIFDGKRKFGPYSPDLSGWHNTIRPKLRRMKYETSTIVARIMQEYNIGPIARVLLELVPSAILYSRMKREQHGTSNYTPDQMSEAYDDLRQFDT